VRSLVGLELLFGTIYWKSRAFSCIEKNVIQLRKIVHQKNVEARTLGDIVTCMIMLFVWYGIFNILLY